MNSRHHTGIPWLSSWRRNMPWLDAFQKRKISSEPSMRLHSIKWEWWSLGKIRIIRHERQWDSLSQYQTDRRCNQVSEIFSRNWNLILEVDESKLISRIGQSNEFFFSMQSSPFVNERLHLINENDGNNSRIEWYQFFRKNERELFSFSGGTLRLRRNLSLMPISTISSRVLIQAHFRLTMVFLGLILFLERIVISRKIEGKKYRGRILSIRHPIFSLAFSPLSTNISMY